MSHIESLGYKELPTSVRKTIGLEKEVSGKKPERTLRNGLWRDLYSDPACSRKHTGIHQD